MLNNPNISAMFSNHLYHLTNVFSKSGATKDSCQTFMYLYAYYLHAIDNEFLRSGIIALGLFHSLLIGTFYDYKHCKKACYSLEDIESRQPRIQRHLNLFIFHFTRFTTWGMYYRSTIVNLICILIYIYIYIINVL